MATTCGGILTGNFNAKLVPPIPQEPRGLTIVPGEGTGAQDSAVVYRNGAYTIGDYADEATSKAALDALVKASACFRSYSEVTGFPIQARLGSELKGLRIDRILTPTDQFVKAGWRHGPIGIEVKKSGHKFGPGLSQLLDYSRAAWEIKPGYHILVELLFLWPVEKQAGTVASIMAQNRVGTVCSTKWTPLKFCVGESVVLRFDANWNPKIANLNCGKRSGSR